MSDDRPIADRQGNAFPESGRPAHEGDWGYLPLEPCRFCRRPGGVFFLLDLGPEGRDGMQTQRCDLCGRTWVADSSAA